MKYPNLKAEMARKGITADELAKETGVHVQTIYAWQNGTTPKVDNALSVSDVLQADVRYLFATEQMTTQ